MTSPQSPLRLLEGLPCMTDVSILRTRLQQAETAYHDLMTGVAVRKFVDQNGESVEYSRANIAQLSSYIEALKQQIAALDGTAAQYRGPIRFTFGRKPGY